MTILKSNKIKLIKSRETSGKQQELKATGKVIQGGKIVWVYKQVKLPYTPNHLTSKEIQEMVEHLPA